MESNEIKRSKSSMNLDRLTSPFGLEPGVGLDLISHPTLYLLLFTARLGPQLHVVHVIVTETETS